MKNLLAHSSPKRVLYTLMASAAFALTTHSALLAKGSAPRLQTTLEQKAAPKEVQWSDIAYWQGLEKKWALAFDKDHQLIAIYDLSFPSLVDRTLITRLGTKKSESQENLSRALLNAAKQNSSILEKEEKSALAKLEIQIKNNRSALSSRTDEAAKEGADPIAEAAKISIEEGDWATIPLKPNLTGTTSIAGDTDAQEFRLSDIDWEAVTSNPEDREKIENYFEEVGTTIFGEAELPDAENSLTNKAAGGSARSVAKSIVFRKENKEIHVYWDPPTRLVESQFFSVSRPKKLVDFRWTPAGFKEGLYWYALETGLDKIANLIQAPFLSAIIKTGLDRVFHYHKMLFRVHQNQFLEYLNDVYDQSQGGSGIFDPTLLTDSEKNLGLEAIIFSQTSLTSTYKWLWRKPFAEFLLSRTKAIDSSEKNQTWFQNKNIPLALLGQRFGESELENENGRNVNLISLGLKTLNPKSNDFNPLIAYSSQDPQKILKSRLVREFITIGVIVGTHFMPGVGGPIRSAYKKLFQSPIDQQVGYEAKWITYLEKRGGYDSVIDTLNRQRINPFVLDLSQSEELIRLRKIELGIPYQP